MPANFLTPDTLFYRVFHHSAVGMVITTIDEGRYVEVNEAFAQLLGFTPDELIGRPSPILGLGHEQERGLVLDVLERAGRLGDLPLVLTTRDGATRYAVGSIQMEKLEGGEYFLSMIQDVTAQRAVEAAAHAVLAERRQLSRDLQDSISQLLYSASLLAETARRHAVAREQEQLVANLVRLGDLTRQSLRQMRLLIFELEPPAPESDGPAGALRHWRDAVEKRAVNNARFFPDDRSPRPPGKARPTF